MHQTWSKTLHNQSFRAWRQHTKEFIHSKDVYLECVKDGQVNTCFGLDHFQTLFLIGLNLISRLLWGYKCFPFSSLPEQHRKWNSNYKWNLHVCNSYVLILRIVSEPILIFLILIIALVRLSYWSLYFFCFTMSEQNCASPNIW